MASTVFPAASAASKTRYVTTLTSGTSYTVPAGVTYVNATLYGAGGGGGCPQNSNAADGMGGQIITTNLSTTPGNSIAYAIGAGGSSASANGGGGAGGNTTFTGATTATGGGGGKGGAGGTGPNGVTGHSATNGGGQAGGDSGSSGSGGSGQIELEYWA